MLKHLRGGMTSWYCVDCLRAGVDWMHQWPWLRIMLILKFGVWPEMAWCVTLWPLYLMALGWVCSIVIEALRDPNVCLFCGGER